MVVENSIESIIFLVYWPITDFEERRWGFERLRSNGYKVEVCDVTYLCNQKEIKCNPVSNELNNEYICKIYSYNELDCFLAKRAKHSFFIDYIRANGDIDKKTEKIFRFLSRHHIQYGIVLANTLPLPNINIVTADKFSRIQSFLRNTLYPLNFYNYLVRKTIIYLRKNRWLYPLPIKIFALDSPILRQFLSKYELDSNIVRKVHSFDYYDYLLSNHENDFPKKKYCVFIDEGIIGSCDWDILGIEKLDERLYSREINKVMCYIESFFNMEVIIAAHPRVNFEQLKDIYPQKRIIQGKTLQLIQSSELILAHYSTVLGLAAFFKKPILLIETSEMKKNGYFSNCINTMATALGLTPFHLAEEKMDDIGMHLCWSVEKYEEYVNSYIKSSGVNNDNLWDVISTELKNR